MTKYVQVFNGLEVDAAEGSLNWPWVPAEAKDERAEAARERARAHVAATLEAATADEAGKRGPGRPKKSEPSGA